MECSWYNKTQARQAKQNAVESKLKSCAGCLFYLAYASHPGKPSSGRFQAPHFNKYRQPNTSEIAWCLLLIYLNTTLVSRKRHFTYRLIAVHEALLRPSLWKAFNSASLAEGLRRLSVVVEGPRASARNRRGIPTITHGNTGLRKRTDSELTFSMHLHIRPTFLFYSKLD